MWMRRRRHAGHMITRRPIMPSWSDHPSNNAMNRMLAILLLVIWSQSVAANAGLRWDALQKTVTTKADATNAVVSFVVTNSSKASVRFYRIKPSCGCTSTTAPKTPWNLNSGKFQKLEFATDLRGKRGTLRKSVIVQTSSGTMLLRMNINISEPTGDALRKRNQQIAKADRFAIFHGQCASCHVKPTYNKQGRELYVAACGICHDAEHRADIVTDLRAVKFGQNEIYWRHWITRGKSGTLMPPFARENGGPISKAQVESLIAYMVGDWKKDKPARYKEPAVRQ